MLELRRSKSETEKLNKSFEDTIARLKAEKSELGESGKRADRETEKFKTAVKHMEVSALENEETISRMNLELNQLRVLYKKASDRAKEAEEELFMLENAKKILPKSETTSFENLKTELDCLNAPVCGVERSLGQVEVMSRKRKNPCEEYFILATQAVKMNSTYMDAICTIPTQVLYKKATTREVPFHKWHEWIEDELNSAYIQILFQRDLQRRLG